MAGGIAEPGAAELHRRRRHPLPERPDGRGDPEFYARRGVPGEQIVDRYPLDRLDRLLRDPVTAHLIVR
jgi:hypothetical protein